MFDIEIIPHEVKKIAENVAGVTKQIENYLQTGIALDLAASFPGGEQLDLILVETCEIAIKACKAVEGIADSPAVSAILQRLGADLVNMQTDKHHGVAKCVIWFEHIFNDVCGK